MFDNFSIHNYNTIDWTPNYIQIRVVVEVNKCKLKSFSEVNSERTLSHTIYFLLGNNQIVIHRNNIQNLSDKN